MLRQVSLIDYLENQGFTPVRNMSSRGELLYFSPYHHENKPSFSVSTTKNLWHDYGTGEGGDIFSLVMKLWNVDFPKAKDILRNKDYKRMFYRPIDTQMQCQCPLPFSDINASPLTSNYFLDYCRQRCIDLDVAKTECRQVDYRMHGQIHSAIGFENDKGGWELRSPTVKICTSKYISTRRLSDDHMNVCVFEGFFDYLSFLTMMKADARYKFDYVILNSVSNACKSIAILKDYTRVHCYLDNDAAGDNAFNIINAAVPAESHSDILLPCKDVNDYLCLQWRKR